MNDLEVCSLKAPAWARHPDAVKNRYPFLDCWSIRKSRSATAAGAGHLWSIH